MKLPKLDTPPPLAQKKLYVGLFLVQRVILLEFHEFKFEINKEFFSLLFSISLAFNMQPINQKLFIPSLPH